MATYACNDKKPQGSATNPKCFFPETENACKRIVAVDSATIAIYFSSVVVEAQVDVKHVLANRNCFAKQLTAAHDGGYADTWEFRAMLFICISCISERLELTPNELPCELHTLTSTSGIGLAFISVSWFV